MNTEDLVQGSDEWLAARRGMITGSRVAAILGHSPYGTYKTVMDEMLREYHGLERKFKGNVATDWGTKHEPHARNEYLDYSGHGLASSKFNLQAIGFVVHPDIPWLGCSPDNIRMLDGVPERYVEYKCPYSLVIPDEVPRWYYDQCQLSMMVLDLTSTDLVYWTPDDFKIFPVDVDIDWQREALPVLQDFIDEYRLKALEEYEPYFEVDDFEAVDLAHDLDRIRAEMGGLRKMETITVEALKKFVDPKKDTVIGVWKAIHATRKGAVNTKKIAKELDLDLDDYRNKDTNYITFKRFDS